MTLFTTVYLHELVQIRCFMAIIQTILLIRWLFVLFHLLIGTNEIQIVNWLLRYFKGIIQAIIEPSNNLDIPKCCRLREGSNKC